jgi:hypothetical protein
MLTDAHNQTIERKRYLITAKYQHLSSVLWLKFYTSFLSRRFMACSSVKFSSPGARLVCGPSEAPFVKSLGWTLCSVMRVEPFAKGSWVTPPGTLCKRFESTVEGSVSPVPVRTSSPALSLAVCGIVR